MRTLLPAALFLSVSALSCSKSSKADAAFYIRPGDITVQTSAGQGAGTHRITDLWVYYNGNFIGAFPQGNLIPIPAADQPCSIRILPGIRNNGISTTRLYWALYQAVTIDTLVSSGTTVERPLTFKYHPQAKFAWVEGFDSQQGYTLRKSSGSDTTYRKASPSESLDGNSAELGLTGSDRIAQVETGDWLTLPSANNNLYLELNYKGDTWMLVGLMDENGLVRDVMTLAPQYSWNKIYISLAYAAGYPYSSTKYKVIFRTVKADDVASARIFLDNIKVLYL